jgi:hypothetical protein
MWVDCDRSPTAKLPVSSRSRPGDAPGTLDLNKLFVEPRHIRGGVGRALLARGHRGGIGSMAAMFLVAPPINRVDNRLIILFGLLTAVSMWQMSQFSLQKGMTPVTISGLLQGFGLGCTQVPLNIIALSTLPGHILTQGTAIRRHKGRRASAP